MKKKKNNTVGIIVLFLIGLFILLYPTIADTWNRKRAEELIAIYEDNIKNVDTSTIETEKEKAIKYNESLTGKKVPDAFAYEEANQPNDNYEKLLNLNNDGYICTVEIPVIDVKLPVYHYTTEEVLLKGVGHLPGSSLPIGGINTHAILSAHRGLPSAKLFTDLDRVSLKDIFYIHVLNETLAYEVDLIKVIEPTETDDLAITENKDYATLFTCTPYAVNSHRLLVRGHRIPYSAEQYEIEQNKTGVVNSGLLIIRIICVLLGIDLALIIIYIKLRLEKNKKRQENIDRSKS